jgi:hypothetical protein
VHIARAVTTLLGACEGTRAFTGHPDDPQNVVACSLFKFRAHLFSSHSPQKQLPRNAPMQVCGQCCDEPLLHLPRQ